MRILLLLSFCFFGCQQKPSEGNSKVDLKPGYKDLALDQPLSYFKDKVEMTLYKDDTCMASKEFSVTSGRHLTIGNTALKDVMLEFVKDSLYRTLIEAEYSGLEGDNLITAYKSEFGEPTKQGEVEEGSLSHKQYEWEGDKHYIKITDRVSNLMIEYGSYPGLNRWTRESMACDDRKKQSLQGNL